MKALFLLVALVMADGAVVNRKAFDYNSVADWEKYVKENMKGDELKNFAHQPQLLKFFKMGKEAMRKCDYLLPVGTIVDMNGNMLDVFDVSYGRNYEAARGILTFIGCVASHLFVEKTEGPLPNIEGEDGKNIKLIDSTFQAIAATVPKSDDYFALIKRFKIMTLLQVYQSGRSRQSSFGAFLNEAALIALNKFVLLMKTRQGKA